MARKILLVDDEPLILKGLKYSLEQDGYLTDSAMDGEEALAKFFAGEYDLILLDVMLPGLDGIEVCQRIRERSNVPIIMLTAKGEDMDKILGLEYGADDYISKPFSIRQVIARVKAVLRRTSEKSKEKEIEKLEYETLALDTKRIKATVDGVEVPLTKKEFEILKLLLENKGNVFSREEILSRIWKDEVYVLDRTIDVNITRLRKKIGPYGKNIVTRLGFGYCFEC